MGRHRVYRERKYLFGQQLLTLRIRTALTQTELAEHVGVHRRSVQNWEAGESYPKTDALQRLLAAFLNHGAFMAGQEHEEAAALWTLAEQDAPHQVSSFDNQWFGQTLALRASAGDQLVSEEKQRPQPSTDSILSPTLYPLPPPPNAQRLLIDWGESIDVPTLFGRESELATLRQWLVDERCRVITIVGLGGVGKSSLALTLAHELGPQFDVVLFRSLQNGPALADVLDQLIHAASAQPVAQPHQAPNSIARLVQLFRERRCLLILDNFETILQPSAISGTYRTGYAEYSALLQSLGERGHQSCVVLTSRERLTELGPLEGASTPVRSLRLGGLDATASQRILAAKDIGGTASDLHALTQLYGGNPLALNLVAEPIHELFNADIGAFLALGDAAFNTVGSLLDQQLARSTPLEQMLLYWLAIERELAPFNAMLSSLGEVVPRRDLLVALDSLRRRLLVERAAERPAFGLQPVILEYLTAQLVEAIVEELVTMQPTLLHSCALIQATAKNYVRRSQEQLIAIPVLERLAEVLGGTNAVEQQVGSLLEFWRHQPPAAQGYGPGNLVNLLRLLRGNLRGLDCSNLAIRQVYFQGVGVQDSNFTNATIQEGVFTETFDAITEAAINSTGEYWAAGGRRGEVQVWAAGGLTLHRMWRAHTDVVSIVTFSPDGGTLATSGSWDGTLKLWDVASGSLLWMVNHPSRVNRGAFAPDGSVFASSANDGLVRLWDRQSGSLLQALPHPNPAFAVAWSPDGGLLASGDQGGAIYVWEVHGIAPPTCIQTLGGHANSVERLAFNPAGNLLASASWDSTIKLWRLPDGQLRRTLVGAANRMTLAVWSPDGQILAGAGADALIRLWDVERDSYPVILQGHSAEVTGLTFTPDGRGILSGSEDGTLRLWDLASRQCLRVMQGYANSLYDIAWSPDGTQLVGGGSDTMVAIYSLSGAPPRVLPGHSGVVIGVGWSADGRLLASSEWENAVRLWDPSSGRCLEVLQHSEDPHNFFDRLAWSPDGRRLACGTYALGVEVFEITAQRPRSSGYRVPTWIRHVDWSPDGALLAGGGADGAVYVWNTLEGTLIHRLAGYQNTIMDVVWSPDGTRLASASGSSTGGELFVWDARRGERIQTLSGHPGTVSAVVWGRNEGQLLSGGGDGSVRCWDLRDGTCRWVREMHQGTVQALRRSPDGAMLASCGDDGAIRLWDLQSGAHIQTLRRDRPYERMDITGLLGVTTAQRAALRALGAIEQESSEQATAGSSAPLILHEQYAADPEQRVSSQPSATSSLPPQPTSFVGRTAELAEIASMLGDPSCRLLTLLGPGGIGKTRLALESAAAQAPRFADGVAFVPLASVGDRDLIVPAISDTLNLDQAGQPDLIEHLLQFLRERRMLLVLDNFEHLLDGAGLISTLLAGAPHVVILATSRARLNLQAEWLLDVEGLAYPQSDRQGAASQPGLVKLESYSAVQLFVQRATQVQPQLQLTEPTLALIAQICQQVAGMPLAIELAAASVRSLSIAKIEQRIRTNLDALATTLRDVPARHRSMRAVFDHSWSLLSASERALFTRLAVFRGGWTIEAVAAVCRERANRDGLQERNQAASLLEGSDDLFPILAALIDKSLVQRDRATRPLAADPAAMSTMPELRYTMLELTREYALEHLKASSYAAATQQRHAYYFMTLAEAATAQWSTPQLSVWLQQLYREYDNMRAALQWARDDGDSVVGLRIAGALWKFWQGYGYTSEGRAWLGQMLTLDDPNPTPVTMVARLCGLQAAAWLASGQHDDAQATQLLEQSMLLRQTLRETTTETNPLVNTARQARTEGRYQQAAAALEEALSRYRELRDTIRRGGAELGMSIYDLGMTLRVLGLVYREQGDFARASALFDESLLAQRRFGDREGLALTLIGLADVARDQGNAARVREYGAESLAILRDLRIQWAIGFALNTLAQAALIEREYGQALAWIDESVTLFRELNAYSSLAEVLITQGAIRRALGHLSLAEEAMSEALRLAMAVGPRLMIAVAMEGLASLVVAQAQAAGAVQLLAAAAALRAQMGTPARPVDQPVIEDTRAAAQLIMGDEAVATAWAQALALTPEQILSTLASTRTFGAT